MKTDINYSVSTFHVSLFPNNDEAVKACNKVTNFFSGNVPISAWNSVRDQLLGAGYSVRKSIKRNSKKSNSDLLALLS